MPASKLVGQEIIRLDVDCLPDTKRNFSPVLHLSNGLQLHFRIVELQPGIGTYGVVLRTIKPARQ